MKRVKQLRKQRGFTLLELLMVVIIIAILASLALPQYLRTVAKARRSEALNVLATLRSAELRYAAEHRGFTNASANLDIDYDPELFNNNANTSGSWFFGLDAEANNAVAATGKPSTTVANCVLIMDILVGTVDDSTGVTADGNTDSCP